LDAAPTAPSTPAAGKATPKPKPKPKPKKAAVKPQPKPDSSVKPHQGPADNPVIKRAAIGKGALRAAYKACDGRPTRRDAKRCVVLACRNQNPSKARRYYARVAPNAALANLCLSSKIVVSDPPTRSVGKKEDVVVPAPPTKPIEQKLLRESIQAALTGNGSAAKAYEACDKTDRFAAKCLILACRNRNARKARRFFSRIQNPQTRASLANLCMSHKILLEP